MTIAACYLSSEGVVLGADSTTTMFVPGPGNRGGQFHHYTFAQKIFELGEDSTVAFVTWGLGSLRDCSYRTLIANLADRVKKSAPSDLLTLASLWSEMFWTEYVRSYSDSLGRARELHSRTERSQEEEEELDFWVQRLSLGFCIAGRWGTRDPAAYELCFSPWLSGQPAAKAISPGYTRFWGCPNLIERLVFGIDFDLFSTVLASPHWTGTHDQLFELVAQAKLSQPIDLPIREAVDWVFASVYTTIKAMKFSHLAPVCGGPIEIGVITSDRPFRWVRHKSLGEAISSRREGSNDQ